MAWARPMFAQGFKKGSEKVLQAYNSKAGQAAGIYTMADFVVASCRDGKSPTAEMVTGLKNGAKAVKDLQIDSSKMDSEFLMKYGPG